jgi:hypothetical protein
MGMGDLPPRLDQIRRLTEDVIAHGFGADEGWSAAWEHGLHSATLRNQIDDGRPGHERVDWRVDQTEGSTT